MTDCFERNDRKMRTFIPVLIFKNRECTMLELFRWRIADHLSLDLSSWMWLAGLDAFLEVRASAACVQTINSRNIWADCSENR
jgi:hypothetical protein